MLFLKKLIEPVNKVVNLYKKKKKKKKKKKNLSFKKNVKKV